MRNRALCSMAAVAALMALVLLLTVPMAAQTPSAAAKPAVTKAAPAVKNWTPPKTADGQPDIQGVFSSATSVPLQRNQNLGAKEFYTEEEFAAAQARQPRQAAEPGETGPLAVHYDVAQFGLDRSHAKTVTSMRTSMIVGPEGRVPPLTADAAKRQQQRQAFTREHQWDGPETRPLAERCIMWPAEGPPMLPEGYNSNLQIVQGPGYVAVMQEMIHDVRIIPTDGRPHLPANVRSYMGDARGHWEGNTLVVETTNFTEKTAINNTPTSDKLKIIERFSRVDPDTVMYQFTVDDPATWTKPWTAEYVMTKIDSPIYEYACHEGNYGMANNLSGARAEEKKAGK